MTRLASGRATRLAYGRYRELLTNEGSALGAAAYPGLDAPVPSCPGWDVREVVRHTASVYRHKVATLELGRGPERGEWASSPPDGEQLLGWFHESLDAIDQALAQRTAEDPAWTWWPPEQTCGFWARRMALETVVHRADAELAVGTTSPIAEDLALDGIDEVLCVMLVDAAQSREDSQLEVAEPHGSVGVRADETTWTVRLRGDGVDVTPETPFATDASLSGDPGALFLYLWGRGPLERLDTDGDLALIETLRRRIARATQ